LKQLFKTNSIIQFVLLMAVWLMMSGHYDLTHISMGIISSVIVLLLHIPLRKFYAEEEATALKGVKPYRLRIMRMFFYVPWLIWQIVIASLQVAVLVLKPKMPVDPSLIRFKTNLPNTSAKVILANSITLTPGTITLRVSGDEFLVHAVMDESSSGILDDSLPGEVAKLYEKKPDQVVHDVEIIKSGAKL